MSDEIEQIQVNRIAKVNDELGLVFGFAIVCKIDGEDHFDSQGDHIPEDAMLKASADFAASARVAKEMHTGDQVGDYLFLFPMTTDIAKSMGIELKQSGLMVAMKAQPDVIEKFKDGTYTGFSIGGARITDEEVD
jgi:hypothetical protein